MGSQSILVFVMADINQSPRMIRHIERFLSHGYSVDCVAYNSSNSHIYRDNPRFAIHDLPTFASISQKKGASRFIYTIFKVVAQSLMLIWISLFKIRKRPGFIVNQNPPSLPLFFIIPLITIFYNSKWIIDWHNFGYSILKMTGCDDMSTNIYYRLEFGLGKYAHSHICVTTSMKEHLVKKGFNKDLVYICYDRPGNEFKKTSFEEVHPILKKIFTRSGNNSTPFTEEKEYDGNTKIVCKQSKPIFIISPTSWTVDENFNILLEAIDLVEKNTWDNIHRSIIILITGKGPLKDCFDKKISVAKWRHFDIALSWLDWEDYVCVLGSCDLGLSFHTSSSNVDFPMKIMDMIGCELPVISFKFSCVEEFIQESKNGLLFTSAKELSNIFIKLMSRESESLLHNLKENGKAQKVQQTEWSEYWNESILRLFDD